MEYVGRGRLSYKHMQFNLQPHPAHAPLWPKKTSQRYVYHIVSFFSASVVQNPFCSWHAASRFPKKWGVKGLRVGVKLALIVTFLFGRQSPQQRVSRWPEGWADIWNNFIRQLELENRGGPLSPLNPAYNQLLQTILRIIFFRCAQPAPEHFDIWLFNAYMAVSFKPKQILIKMAR